MNRLFPPVTLLAFCLCTGTTAQTAAKTSATPSPTTAPAVVTPAPGDVLIPAPSDAQVLFDGKDLAQWCRKDGSPAAWAVENGDMVVKAKSGNIQTKRNFGDCQLHIEWCTPENVSDGQAGSIYKQYAPLVNATKAPGQWNVYDIIYTAPRFNADGSLLSAARITVLQNGVLVQNNTTIKGTTFLEHPAYTAHGDAPIMLQDHGNAVRFRNIWIREL